MDKPDTTSADMSAQERFFRHFQQEVIALQEQMARVCNTPTVGGERKDATDHCLAGITRLSAEVKDASSTLPSYDVRSYTEAIKALQEKLSETTAAYTPKQKFAFKTKKNASAISITDAAEMVAPHRQTLTFQSSTSTPGSSYPTTRLIVKTPPHEANTTIHPAPPPTRNSAQTFSTQGASISNRTAAISMIPPSEIISNSPCQINNIQKSIINLSTTPTPSSSPQSFASLTLTHITSTLLISGPISGPTHVTSVTNSVLVLPTRQFRMHACRNVDVYLFCPSRPIIEDCSGIRFAPLTPETLASLVSDDALSATNQWNQIDDFKWLKAEPSPNWSVIAAGEEVGPRTWEEIITAAQRRVSMDAETKAEGTGKEDGLEVGSAEALKRFLDAVGIKDEEDT